VLHIACKLGNVNVLLLLLGVMSSTSLNVQSAHGETPLHGMSAMEREHDERILISSGLF
jgi:hypothetical protein